MSDMKPKTLPCPCMFDRTYRSVDDPLQWEPGVLYAWSSEGSATIEDTSGQMHDIPVSRISLSDIPSVRKEPDECPAKCTVCKDASHHWIPDPRPAVKNDYICKHCPALGDECVVCETTGCAVCNSEGVILITTELGKGDDE